MANESIKISFSSIDNGIRTIGGITESLSTCSSSLESAWNRLDSRVRNKLGSNYDVSKIDDIKKKIEDINSFLGIVLITYQAADIDLSSPLSIEQLSAIYPDFINLPDERKAIVLSALRYLGLNGSQVMSYSSNFSSAFADKQFRGDAINHAWCAMFVGSMISYFFGAENGGIINPSYASVWKIIGTYNNQAGIAFNPDDRVHYYVSQACINLYNSGNPDYQYSKWQRNLDSYNASHGTNIKVSDWVDEDFVPEAGDIIVFSSNNRNGGEKHYYPNDTLSNTHIGFVLGTREVNGTLYIDTVEGNVRNDVEVRSFKADDPYLVGYGHIDYERFYSDQSAVQKTISEGIDVSASGATVGLLTSQLLNFNPNSAAAKETYLVNLANNIGNETAATVGATHIPATVSEDKPVVTTTSSTTTETSPAVTTVSTNTSVTPTYTTTTSNRASTTATTTTSGVSYSSPKVTTSQQVSSSEVVVTDEKVTTETAEDKTYVEPVVEELKETESKLTWSDLYKDKDKYVNKYVSHAKESYDVEESPPEKNNSFETHVEKIVEQQTQQDTPNIENTVNVEKTYTQKDVTPKVSQEIDEVVDEPIEELEEKISVEPVVEDVLEKHDEVVIGNQEETEFDSQDYDTYEPQDEFEYPNPSEEPVIENPNVVEKATSEASTTEQTPTSSSKKKTNWLGVAAGLGIATGGAAIAYTVTKRKKEEDE